MEKIASEKKDYKKVSLEEICDYENSEIGTLKFYDCPKCKNKGLIYYIKDGCIVSKNCECYNIRKTYYNLEKCGISKEMLEKNDIKNFETSEKWQNVFKSKIESYINDFENDKTNFSKWLFVSGISGCGKTMLSTYVLKVFIQNGKKGKYMLWKDSLPQIKSLKKSYNVMSQEKYEEIMEELKTIDVLYIDDFFKLIDNYSMNEDLNIAYEIINARYNNNLITIFSSELSQNEIANMDLAICGRINEKCNGYWIKIQTDKTKDNLKRNYRLKDLEII